MQWYADHVLHLATTTFIENFLTHLRAKVLITTRLLINLRNIMPSIRIACFNSSLYEEMIFTTPEM